VAYLLPTSVSPCRAHHVRTGLAKYHTGEGLCTAHGQDRRPGTRSAPTQPARPHPLRTCEGGATRGRPLREEQRRPHHQALDVGPRTTREAATAAAQRGTARTRSAAAGSTRPVPVAPRGHVARRLPRRGAGPRHPRMRRALGARERGRRPRAHEAAACEPH